MVFFDSNVLVYVHDQRFPHKRETARRLYASYLYQDAIALSTQVLQEFYVTITRKASQMSVGEAKNLVRHLAGLRVVTIDANHIIAAIDLHSRYQLSFWDSLIICCRQSCPCCRCLERGHGPHAGLRRCTGGKSVCHTLALDATAPLFGQRGIDALPAGPLLSCGHSRQFVGAVVVVVGRVALGPGPRRFVTADFFIQFAPEAVVEDGAPRRFCASLCVSSRGSTA